MRCAALATRVHREANEVCAVPLEREKSTCTTSCRSRSRSPGTTTTRFHYPPFDDLDHQRPCIAIAHVDGRLQASCASTVYSPERRVARDVWGDGPVRSTPATLSPGRAARCGPARPAGKARPGDRADAETNTDVPSRHPRQSTHAAAAYRCPATSPTPTDAASSPLDRRLRPRRHCPDGPDL